MEPRSVGGEPGRRPRDAALAKSRVGVLLFERGWTDQDLAERSGLERVRINRIKNGRVQPTVREALLIARAFGCRVGDVFSLPDDGPG